MSYNYTVIRVTKSLEVQSRYSYKVESYNIDSYKVESYKVIVVTKSS